MRRPRSRPAAAGDSVPFVAGVVLAAGGSRRLPGTTPKQLLDFGGEPLVRRVTRAALAAPLAQVIVVLGHEATRVAAAVAGLDVETVVNRDWGSGQSTSVRAGLSRVAEAARAAIFLPCDQPFLDAAVIAGAVAAWRASGAPIVVPAWGERPGAPVLFERSLFPRLLRLEGDAGGRLLAARHPELVHRWQLPDERPLLDVDTPADLERLRRLAEA